MNSIANYLSSFKDARNRDFKLKINDTDFVFRLEISVLMLGIKIL